MVGCYSLRKELEKGWEPTDCKILLRKKRVLFNKGFIHDEFLAIGDNIRELAEASREGSRATILNYCIGPGGEIISTSRTGMAVTLYNRETEPTIIRPEDFSQQQWDASWASIYDMDWPQSNSPNSYIQIRHCRMRRFPVGERKKEIRERERTLVVTANNIPSGLEHRLRELTTSLFNTEYQENARVVPLDYLAG